MFAKLSKKVALALGASSDDVRLIMLSGNMDVLTWLNDNREDLSDASDESISDKTIIHVDVDNRRYAYIPEEEIVFAWL